MGTGRKKNNRLTHFRGAPVLVSRRLKDYAFSVGLIVLGQREYDRSVRGDTQTLQHEYGHVLQLLIMGLPVYLLCFAIPSFICYWSHKFDSRYYTLPWEYTADRLGGAKRRIEGPAVWRWVYFAGAACLAWGLRLWILWLLLGKGVYYG